LVVGWHGKTLCLRSLPVILKVRVLVLGSGSERYMKGSNFTDL
jgi:hypothetical protein